MKTGYSGAIIGSIYTLCMLGLFLVVKIHMKSLGALGAMIMLGIAVASVIYIKKLYHRRGRN